MLNHPAAKKSNLFKINKNKKYFCKLVKADIYLYFCCN